MEDRFFKWIIEGAIEFFYAKIKNVKDDILRAERWVGSARYF